MSAVPAGESAPAVACSPMRCGIGKNTPLLAAKKKTHPTVAAEGGGRREEEEEEEEEGLYLRTEGWYGATFFPAAKSARQSVLGVLGPFQRAPCCPAEEGGGGGGWYLFSECTKSQKTNRQKKIETVANCNNGGYLLNLHLPPLPAPSRPLTYVTYPPPHSTAPERGRHLRFS